jgi:hypothetical protein
MNRDTPTTRDETNDPISGQRLTTLRESHKDVIKPRNPYTHAVSTDSGRSLEYPL